MVTFIDVIFVVDRNYTEYIPDMLCFSVQSGLALYRLYK